MIANPRKQTYLFKNYKNGLVKNKKINVLYSTN